MVADLEYWGQTTPVEVFLEKLAKQYSVNAVRKLGGVKCYTLALYSYSALVCMGVFGFCVSRVCYSHSPLSASIVPSSDSLR